MMFLVSFFDTLQRSLDKSVAGANWGVRTDERMLVPLAAGSESQDATPILPPQAISALSQHAMPLFFITPGMVWWHMWSTCTLKIVVSCTC